MATRMAEPITVRGRPSLEDTLARWLTEDPRLLEQELIEGSLGRTANPRLEALLQGGKGSLLRKLLRIPEAEKQLFSFEQLKDILRDARKVPSLGEGQRALDAGFTGESKGQTVFDFPSPKVGRETLVDVHDALPSEASPPNMSGPDIVPAPGPKLYPKARAVKGNRGLALVQDKLFGGKAWSESSKQARDALGEAIEEVQDFNSQGRLKAFLQKRYNLSPDQVDGLVAELGLPKGGVETVRGRAAAKLYEQGQVHGSHFMAGTGGDDPKIAMRLIDEIRNRTGGMSHKDVARRAGQDVLTGMTPDEADKFIREEKSRGARAGRPTRAPYIWRELPERPDFEPSAVQKEVQDRVREFKKITDKFDGMIPPGKLMAGIEPGPGRAKSIAAFAASQKKYNEAIKALDATFAGPPGGETHAIANKFILEIVKERPDLNAEVVRKLMPNLWGRIQHPKGDETLAQAVVKRAADFASERAAEATGKGERLYQMQPRRRGSELTSVAGLAKNRPIPEGNNPMGWEFEGDRAFMAQEVDDVRQSLRTGPTGPDGKPRPTLEVLPHGEAPPKVHPQLQKVLNEQARLKTILASGADDLDAYNAALYEAKFAWPDATNIDVPSPPKPKYTPDELKMSPRMKEIRGRAKMVEWRRMVQEAAERQAALEKNAFTNPINHDVKARQFPTFRQVTMGVDPDDVAMSMTGVGEVGVDDVEEALPGWLRKKYEKMVDEGVPHEAALQDILGDQRWQETVRSGRRGQAELERLIAKTYPPKDPSALLKRGAMSENQAARLAALLNKPGAKKPGKHLEKVPTSPKKNAGIQLAALLRDGEKGLPASGPKEFEKIAKLAKDRIAAFKDLDLASIKKILRGKGLAGASPQVQQSWKDVQRLTMRRDAHETGQLKKMVMGVIRDEPLAMPRAMKKVPIDVDQVAAKLGPEATTEMLTQALQGAEAEASAVASKTAARVAQAKRLQSILKMLITKL